MSDGNGKEKIKRKVGRPSIYTDKLAKEICDKISTTSKGLVTLCKENPHWPTRDTILDWRAKKPEFSYIYAQAKMHQCNVLVEEMLDIADNPSNDYYVDDRGKLLTDHDSIHRSKLRIDTRKWIAAKLAPRIYGNILAEKLAQSLDDNDGIISVRDLTEQLLLDKHTSH
jgi:hypothetical protein